MFIEKLIKLVLVLIFVIAILVYWLLPKTAFAKSLKMHETLFTLTNLIGILCGLTGLAMTMVQPEKIIEYHLWELIAVPFALVYLYWLLLGKINSGKESIDEKQVFNMTSAAAFAWILSIPVMVFVFMLFQSAVLDGLVWFPIFFFQGLLIFSAATLYFYKNA